MSAVIILIIVAVFYLFGYFVYSKRLDEKVLVDGNDPTPAHEQYDGTDFVPANRWVLFGHHYATIAGLGPIVGPAIAVIWGYLPALLWIVFGNVFIGAVHDFASLKLSLAHKGKSIGDLTEDIIGKRGRILFLLIIYFILSLAMGVFALVISILFNDLYPGAVFPTLSLIGIAVIIGVLIYKTRLKLWQVTIFGLILMAIFVDIGIKNPIKTYLLFVNSNVKKIAHRIDSVKDPVYVVSSGQTKIEKGAILTKEDAESLKRFGLKYRSIDVSRPKALEGLFDTRADTESARSVKIADTKAKDLWTWILLFYALLASILPVWLLLQPRDYMNSYLLYLGLIFIVGGILISNPHIVAPAVTDHAKDAPPIFPFLFIVIACGAVSGFHSLAASGTTVRQLDRVKDARMIGYGSMLLEGVLAALVLIACTAGVGSSDAWYKMYGSWHAASGLGPKLNAFITGAGNIISSLGVDKKFSMTLVSVIVVSFALTTLDSATRLLRYNIEEIGRQTRFLSFLTNKYIASIGAVLSIAFFALMKVDGRPAGLILWQLFGTSNQVLAALALLMVSIYLYLKRRNHLYTTIPMLFVLFFTLYSAVFNLIKFYKNGRMAPLFTGIIILFLTLWLIVEAILRIISTRGQYNPEGST